MPTKRFGRRGTAAIPGRREAQIGRHKGKAVRRLSWRMARHVDLEWHDAREQKLRSCQGFSIINGGVVQPSAHPRSLYRRHQWRWHAATSASGIIRVRLGVLLE